MHLSTDSKSGDDLMVIYKCMYRDVHYHWEEWFIGGVPCTVIGHYTTPWQTVWAVLD